MKDAARLLGYFLATALLGALVAPPLYWTARAYVPALAGFGFETFFHRALLLCALLLLWPLLRSLRVRSRRDLALEKNRHAARDAIIGFLIAAVPLACFGALLLAIGVYHYRSATIGAVASRWVSAAVVPFIEEPLFRGLILGVLLRGFRPLAATAITSGFFSILHFLKAPEGSGAVVTWASGFASIGNAFVQFSEPMLVLAGFTTLFLLGWILADARIRTRSLWLPIGLHAGWILASATFNKLARRELLALPWIGKSLLIGIAPLGVALLSWFLLRYWLRHVETRR